MTKSVYLAGPILHVADHGETWRDTVTSEYSTVFDWVNPLKHADNPDGVTHIDDAAEIVATDTQLIADSDAMLVNWELVPTAGTPIEMYIAQHEYNMPVVVVWDDNDRDLSPWVRVYSTTVVETVDAGVLTLKELVT